MTNNWAQLTTRWIAYLQGAALRPLTIDLRRSQIRRLAWSFRDRNPFELSPSDLAEWLGSHGWERETIRSHRAMMRSFYGWAHVTGITDHDSSRLLPKVAAATPAPRPAREAVVALALAEADERTLLMLLLGRRLGLRRGEIAQVHTHDLTTDGTGRPSLRVHGKGGKIRTVPLPADLDRMLRALPVGFVFAGRHGALTAAHTGKLISAALTEGTTAHQLRHRFATAAYAASGDIVTVSRLLGHASVATTQRYVATDDGQMRTVMDGAS